MEFGLGKRQKGLGAFIVSAVLARTLADAQTNIGGSGMHVQWFSHWKIRVDNHDITK